MLNISRMATAIAMGFFCVMMLAIGTGYAEDVKLDGKISAVQVSQDKNGREYVRVLIPEKKSISGVSYETTTAVMFFGDHVAAGKVLKIGDTLSCIANKRDYKGSASYTVLAMIPKVTK